MTNKNLTIELNDSADDFTPNQIGNAVRDALGFGTDDMLYTYADEQKRVIDIACTTYDYTAAQVEVLGATFVGTITIGAK